MTTYTVYVFNGIQCEGMFRCATIEDADELIRRMANQGWQGRLLIKEDMGVRE